MANDRNKQQETRRDQQHQREKENVNNPIPQEQRPAMNPGEDAAAKTNRKGAGQQQKSGGNNVVNS